MRKILVLLAFAVLLAASAQAAPVEIFNDRIDVDGGNVTELDWLNPGGGAANIGGDLDMRGNSLLTYYSSRCSPGEAIEDIADDGTITCADIAGSVADVYVNETGDTMRGNLSFDNSYWIKSLSDPTSSQDAMTKSFADQAYLNRDGTDFMDGDLDMNGNNVVNVDALGNGTTRTIEMTGTGNVNIPNGNLAMSGNNIQNPGSITSYFGSACTSGEAVEDISDDGTLNCISITGAAADTYVNESGDTMTGDLNMSGNALWRAGAGQTNITSSGDLEVGGIVDLNSNRIKSLQDPSSSQDAMTKGFADSTYLNRDGTDTMNGNLDMNNNDIVNVEALMADGSTTNLDLVDGGNVNIPNGNLRLPSNRIVMGESSGGGDYTAVEFTDDGTTVHTIEPDYGTTGRPLAIRGGDVNIPNGNLDLSGKFIGETDSIGWDNLTSYPAGCDSGNAIRVLGDSGNVDCESISGETHELYVNESGDTMHGDLDMENNQITQIGSGRSNFTSTGRLDMGDIIQMNTNRVRGVQDPTSSQDAVTLSYANDNYLDSESSDSMNGDLDMTGHNILNVDALGNGTVRTIEMTTGGDVNIPNGNLEVTSQANPWVRVNSNDASSGRAAFRFEETGTWIAQLEHQTAENRLRLRSGEVDGSGTTGDLMRWDRDTGNVEIPNGNLDVSSNNVVGVQNLSRPGTTGAELPELRDDWLGGEWNAQIYQTDGSTGTGAPFDVWGNLIIQPRSTSDRSVILATGSNTPSIGMEVTESQNVEIPNGYLDMGNNDIRSVADPDASQDAMTKSFADSTYLNRDGTDSMNGNLDMSNNNIVNVEALMADGSTTNLDLVDGGNVNIPNGNLSVGTSSGDNYVDISYNSPDVYRLLSTGPNNDGSLQIRHQTSTGLDERYMEIKDGGNIEIPNGNLDMGSNQIKSVSDPTSSQDAVTQSYANTNYLNRDGTDTMAGDLDMDGNNLVNVDRIGNGSSPVGLTSNVDMRGNSVTTSTGEVCIGDECA